MTLDRKYSDFSVAIIALVAAATGLVAAGIAAASPLAPLRQDYGDVAYPPAEVVKLLESLTPEQAAKMRTGGSVRDADLGPEQRQRYAGLLRSQYAFVLAEATGTKEKEAKHLTDADISDLGLPLRISYTASLNVRENDKQTGWLGYFDYTTGRCTIDVPRTEAQDHLQGPAFDQVKNFAPLSFTETQYRKVAHALKLLGTKELPDTLPFPRRAFRERTFVRFSALNPTQKAAVRALIAAQSAGSLPVLNLEKSEIQFAETLWFESAVTSPKGDFHLFRAQVW